MTYFRYDTDFIFAGLTEVEPNDSNWTLLPYIDSFNEPKFNSENWVENRALTQAEIVNIEKQKYIKRTNDGIDAYAGISAEFRLAKLRGQMSEQTQHAIENLLIPIRNEVICGQWISGLQKLQELGIEAIGANLYNRLHLQLSNYIKDNY